MKILYDHQIYNNQNYGGISRYFYELSKGIALLGNECRNTIYFSENEFTTDKGMYDSRQFLPFKFKGRARLKERVNRYVSERFLKKGDYDIFHPTYYDPYFLNTKLPDRPFVVTFYDLIHEKFADRYPTLLTNMTEVISSRKTLLSHATKIIAISHSTKKDIVDYYGVPESRIEVTHLASSLSAGNDVADAHWGDYILFVGSRPGYKNFTTFVEGVHSLLLREKSLKLICAGGGKFNSEEQQLINKLGISNQVLQVPIDDRRLATLYSHALFFVFPSLYEGFGIPTLEAFNCACPTILSNVSSLPEVGQEAALYIEPESPEDILSKCELFYYDKELREDYRRRAVAQAPMFSWENVSRQTLDIYQSAL
jgi:glycosyltransferase involved in cell wall biosynthesis